MLHAATPRGGRVIPPVAYRGIGTIFTTGASASYVIDTPDNVIENDVLIAFVYYGNHAATTLTPPASWNHITGSPQVTAAGDTVLNVMWRYAPSSPAANYTWGLSPGQGGSGAMVALKDAKLVDPFDGIAFNTGGSNTSAVGSSISPATSNAILFNAVITAGGRTFTPPGGITQEIVAEANSLNVVYKQLTASGATGTLTHTISSAANWATVMFAVRGT